MAGRDNIVPILRADLFEHRGWIAEADIPELIHSAKRIARKELNNLLQNMFENVDDSLFEYADKAQNNQQQMLYFDAMRQVRLQKDAMATLFHREFEIEFKQVLCGDGSGQKNHTSTVNSAESFASFSLVEEDDLELSLAVTNMVTRIHTAYREPISALVQRMDHVLGEVGLSSEYFPLSGRVLCDSFAAAINLLNAEVQVKLIIYKLFDKFVVQRLGRIYNDINAMFVAAGVLPQIRARAPVNLGSAHKRETETTEQEMLAELQDSLLHPDGQTAEFDASNVFNVMQQLLIRQRNATQQQSPASTSGGDWIGSSNGSSHAAAGAGFAGNGSAGYGSAPGLRATSGDDTGTQAYVLQDVISGLSGIQHDADMTADILAQQQPTGELIKTVLVQNLGGQGGKSGGKYIDRAEADAIDIVSMLFDFILGDRSLPDRLKALIARLQVPMVKVAILDTAFFGKTAHPARQLLNELAYAATVTSEEADGVDSHLYETIEGIVNRVLTEFESDVGIFSELLEEFLDYQAREYESNRLAEEMLEKAKEKVAAEIELRLNNNRVPDQVYRLLIEQWKDVMTVIAIRDGAEGEAWDASINVMDDLIWSVQPKLIVQEKSQLTRIIPRILNGLQEGLTLINFGQKNISALFLDLEKLHHESLKGLQEVGPWAAAFKEPGAVEEIELKDTVPVEGFVFTPVNPALMKSEYYYLVKGMEVGTWLEFNGQGQTKRGKLVWKCEFTNDYTFVDRRYRLVADVSMAELIQCLEQGNVKIVEEVPLFDRAIDAVVKGLKQYMHSGDTVKQPATRV